MAVLDVRQETRRDASEGYPGTPVPILQRHWEFAMLRLLYQDRQPKRVLEVGTYHGGTLYWWLTDAPRDTTVVSIDSYAAGVDNRAQYMDWLPEGVHLHVLAGNSQHPDVIHAATRYGRYDWIVIDAGHAEHEVWSDWHTYAPLLTPGGVIALHDILPGAGAYAWIEVHRVWAVLQRMGYVTQELVADPQAPWGGWGLVYG